MSATDVWSHFSGADVSHSGSARPRVTTSSEVGSLPDTKEGRHEGGPVILRASRPFESPVTLGEPLDGPDIYSVVAYQRRNMTERTVYLVIGHLTPTDADPDPDVQGKLDDGVDAVVCQTDEEIERALLWYRDGVVKAINV